MILTGRAFHIEELVLHKSFNLSRPRPVLCCAAQISGQQDNPSLGTVTEGTAGSSPSVLVAMLLSKSAARSSSFMNAVVFL